MPQIRVLLAEMPRMLQDIVADRVASEPDMVLVGAPVPGRELVAAAARARADVVLLGARDRRTLAACDRLLRARPWVKLITLAREGRDAALHELRPVTTPLGELSAEELVVAIRAAVRREGA